MAESLPAEENLIDAASQLVKALLIQKNITTDPRKILLDLGIQLSAVGSATKDNEVLNLEPPFEIEQLINQVEEKVLKWEVDQSVIIWDCDPSEALEYLDAVDEARKLIKRLECSDVSYVSDEKEHLKKAQGILEKAMVRLDKEFRCLLVHYRQSCPTDRLSFCLSEDGSSMSTLSFGGDSDGIGVAWEDHIITLVNPDVIPYLKAISKLMFESNYGRQCCQTYVSTRKDALNDCLLILDVQNCSIKDQLKMTWSTLQSIINRWIRAMKIFVRVYLTSEKSLSDQIFGDLASFSTVCFVESSETSLLQLLKFGEVIAAGPRQPEKLFRILDMYEVLSDIIEHLILLYSGQAASHVHTESQAIHRMLGNCAKAILSEFEISVANNASFSPLPDGGVDHLTRYVMNYIKILADYDETLKVLLEDHEKKDAVSTSDGDSSVGKEDNNRENDSTHHPVALRFSSLLSLLEGKLDDKSKQYKDNALQQLFLVNNIHYIIEKVRNSELKIILGIEWIKGRNWTLQQHAMKYESASWTSILSLLRDDGICNPSSNSISSTVVKGRLQSFFCRF